MFASDTDIDVNALLVQLITADAEKRLHGSQSTRNAIDKVMSVFEDEPCEPSERLDDLGRSISALVDENLTLLTDSWSKQAEMLSKNNTPVPSTAQLEQEATRWRELKDNLVGTWPWSTRKPTPGDPEMSRESKEALERGEGIPIEDLIRQLGGVPKPKPKPKPEQE